MLDDAELGALEGARIGRLATADEDGRPHVVPVCYAMVAVDGGVRLVTPLDEKPKTTEPHALRRVRDIRVNPRVAVVIDHYAEDWRRLGWVQLRGTATVLEPGDSGHDTAVEALRHRYQQYASHALEHRPVIAIDVGSVRSWGELSGFAAGLGEGADH